MTAGLGAPVAVAKGVGAAAVGVSVAGNAYGSALKDGYSIGQARAYSTLVGAAEATLQYLLGGIGALGGITDDLIKVKINMIDNSLLRIGAKLGVDVSFEGLEEELQKFLEPAFRSIIFGEEYDAPTIHEMLETAVVTGITTLVLGGGDTVRSDLSENIQLVESGQKIMGTDGGLDMLMSLANEVAGVSSAQIRSTLTSQIDKVDQYATARNVGQLYATVQAANNQTNASADQEDIATSLRNKGVSSKQADGIQLVESGQKIMGTDGGLDMLMSLANEVAGLSSAQMQNTLTRQIDKVSQNPTARNVGQLNATAQTANNQAIASVKPEDIATGLRNKGVSSKKADGIIVARLNGQEFTRPQRKLLSSALESSAVRDTISELLQKKSNGIDSVQNDVYDNSNIRDGLTNEEKAASWKLSNPSVDAFSNHDDATVTEDSPVHQPQNTPSEGVFDGGLDISIKNIHHFVEGNKSFEDVLDDFAKVYADKINSNQLWSWEDTIPGGENLTPKQRRIIKQQAVDAEFIPDIKVTKVEGMRYGFADFESAEVVVKTEYLPENMWKMSNAEQFKWLDKQNGGSVEGYTWHHTETPGKMQLVPTGIHNVTTHNGGRTAGMWAEPSIKGDN